VVVVVGVNAPSARAATACPRFAAGNRSRLLPSTHVLIHLRPSSLDPDPRSSRPDILVIMLMVYMRVTGSARGRSFLPVVCPRVIIFTHIHTRGRELMPIPLPVGSGIRGYPRPRVELPSLAGTGDTFHATHYSQDGDSHATRGLDVAHRARSSLPGLHPPALHAGSPMTSPIDKGCYSCPSGDKSAHHSHPDQERLPDACYLPCHLCHSGAEELPLRACRPQLACRNEVRTVCFSRITLGTSYCDHLVPTLSQTSGSLVQVPSWWHP
jgi:hypothetical protein